MEEVLYFRDTKSMQEGKRTTLETLVNENKSAEIKVRNSSCRKAKYQAQQACEATGLWKLRSRPEWLL